MMRVLTVILIIGLAISAITPQNVIADKTIPPANFTVDQAIFDEITAIGSASYWVNFHSEVDLAGAYEMDWSSRGWYVYEQLKKVADDSQAKFLQSLDRSKTPYQSFWIKNTVLVENSNLSVLNSIQAFPDVESVTPRKSYFLYDADASTGVTAIGLNAIEPNLTHINADDVWAMGINGSGLVVANIDTGVLYSHHALVSQYRGNHSGTFDHNYNWFSPDNLLDNVPYDGHGHGTHTMGTMVGDDGVSNHIGLAPRAKWIACAGCPNGECTDTALLECGQWITAPTDLSGANPNPDMRPNVVNNSWGDCGQTYDAWYENVITAWHLAGIYPIFSSGNASICGYYLPPRLNTVGNPARSGKVTSVGSTGNQNGLYASHSNWGPTDDLDTINPTDGFAALKLQVLAPGVYIRSTYNTTDTSYALMSGTSMSAPHVAGLVALMWQAAPCLVGNYALTESLIESNATDMTYDDGSPETPTNFPNYATGWGEIDALAAVTEASLLCSMDTALFLPLIVR